jgi:hypothetical protein
VAARRRALPHNLLGFVDLETGLLEVLHDPLGERLAGIVRRRSASMLHLIFGAFGVPLGMLLSPDAYYFALLPIVRDVATSAGVPVESVARAMLIGENISFVLSPVVPSVYLAIGLAGVELHSHIRYTFVWVCRELSSGSDDARPAPRNAMKLARRTLPELQFGNRQSARGLTSISALGHDRPIDACPWQVRSMGYSGRKRGRNVWSEPHSGRAEAGSEGQSFSHEQTCLPSWLWRIERSR